MLNNKFQSRKFYSFVISILVMMILTYTTEFDIITIATAVTMVLATYIGGNVIKGNIDKNNRGNITNGEDE